MTVRPSPPMRDFEVSAILREVAETGSGKSQFRRVLKPRPFIDRSGNFCVPDRDGGYANWGQNIDGTPCTVNFIKRHLPFAIGDLLWCREAWAKVGDEPDDIHACPDMRVHAYYRADAVDPERQHWRSSTQMPRWASRLTLEVVGVKIERLQGISEEDAEIELRGMTLCPTCRDAGWINEGPDGGWQCTAKGCGDGYIEQFQRIWADVHGPGSWSTNPFVAAVQFRPHLVNVDLLRQREGGR